jgi:hypothetical protein
MQPTQPKPVVLRKSRVGLVGIYLFGALAVIILIAAGTWFLRTGQVTMGLILLATALIAFIAAAVQAYVYLSTKIIITKTELTVVSWGSLFNERVDSMSWYHAQDVQYSKQGILSMLFDIGTLRVESSATMRTLVISYIGEPEKWRNYMDQLSSSATTPVTEQ